MMYQYNYSFLSQWLEANKDIKRQDVREALGVKSNNGLKAWADKKGPMPILNIIRFCNSFQVPIACFFRDLDTDMVCDFTPEQPNVNDQLEPNGGYDASNKERGRGERFYEDPTNCKPQRSNLPDDVPAIPTKQEEKQKNSQGTTQQQSLTFDAQALIALENKHSDERKRLLNIIDDLQKQNASLLQLVDEYRNRPYHVVQQYEPEEEQTYGMVAEDLHNS